MASKKLKKHSQIGFSLVELMVALALGLLISAGVVTVFISAKQDYQVQDAISQVQENARFSLEFLAHDIRMAGFSGCNNNMPTANSVENAGGVVGDFEEGIQGFEGDGSSTLPTGTFPDALPNTDAVMIHTADLGSQLVVNNHNPNAAQIDVTNAHSYKPGSIMMIVDSNCSGRGIFVMSGPTNNSNNATNQVHNTGKTFTVGSSSGVGNCTKKLKGEFTCSDQSGALGLKYSDGSSVYAITSIGYYVKDPSKDATLTSPTLYQINFAADYLPGATTTSQPLVEGVRDLDLMYGVRGSSGSLQYKDADAVEASGEWQEVVSVRISVKSESLTNVDGAPLDRDFVRTVKLRNR